MDIAKLQRFSLYKLIILTSSLFFLIIMINSISSDIGNTYKNDYSSRVEINIKSNFGDEQKLIKPSGLEIFKMQYSSESISYMNELDSFLQTGNVGYPVKAVLSGENLENFLSLNILRGTFFSKNQYEYGKKVAVISDTMAQKLFTSHNVIGNEINISGLKYKIIGLFRNKNSLFSLLGSDGVERVYIPSESLSNNGLKIVNTVFIKDKRLQAESFKVNTIEKALSERLMVDSYLYKINDFYYNSSYTSQPLSMFIFLVGILCICLLIKYFIEYLKFGFLYLKKGMKNNYLLQILVKWKLRIPVFLILAALIPLFIGTVFWLIRFKGAIPQEYIPANNVFDFGFYANKVKEAIYSANNNVGYAPTELEILFHNNLTAIYVLMSFVIINFIAVVSTIKLNKMVCESSAKQNIMIVVSLFIGLAVAFVFCLVCGIKYSFPAKAVAILVLFLAINLVNKRKVEAKTYVDTDLK